MKRISKSYVVVALLLTALWIGFSVIYGLRLDVTIGFYVGVLLSIYMFIILQYIHRISTSLESIADSKNNP